MKAIACKKVAENYFRLEGALTFQSVPGLVKSHTDFLSPGAPSGVEVRIDLSGITDFDSASLALLLSWVGEVEANQGRLIFENIPPQMLDIARVSGLDDVFEFAH